MSKAGNKDDYLVERAGGVWTFIINRPASRNSLTWDMRYDFMRIVDEAERDPGCSVLIVTGAGDRAFCSGADVEKLAEELDKFDDFWMGEALPARRRCPPVRRAAKRRIRAGVSRQTRALDRAVCAGRQFRHTRPPYRAEAGRNLGPHHHRR